MIDTNNLLTVNEVAKQLKLTVPSVKLLIKNDQLKAKQSGNQWLISVKNLNEYIKINNINLKFLQFGGRTLCAPTTCNHNPL